MTAPKSLRIRKEYSEALAALETASTLGEALLAIYTLCTVPKFAVLKSKNGDEPKWYKGSISEQWSWTQEDTLRLKPEVREELLSLLKADENNAWVMSESRRVLTSRVEIDDIQAKDSVRAFVPRLVFYPQTVTIING